MGAAAALGALVGVTVAATPADRAPQHQWLWVAGSLLLAGALGIRARRVEDPDPPSRTDVAFEFLAHWLTWRVLAIAAAALLLLGIAFGTNKPWAPLKPCSAAELRDAYTGHKCLVRARDGRVIAWDRGGGDEFVRDSGSINDIDFTVTSPTLDRYDWRYKPGTAWILTALAFGGLGFSAWLRASERRRKELAAAREAAAAEARRRAEKKAARSARKQREKQRRAREPERPVIAPAGPIPDAAVAASMTTTDLQTHIYCARVAILRGEDIEEWAHSRSLAERELQDRKHRH